MDDAQKFDDYADQYDEALARGIAVSGEDKNYFARGRVAWLAHRLEEMGLSARSALDFGCGTGSATPFLLELLPLRSLLGVDVSQASLRRAREEFASPLVSFCTPGECLGRGDLGLDLAFCNGVFHHIAPAQRGEALELVRGALRPGGVFALWENNAWNPATRFVMSRCPFDDDAMPLAPPQARRLLRTAGLRVLRTDFQFIFPRALHFLRGLEAPLARFPLGTQYLVLAQRD